MKLRNVIFYVSSMGIAVEFYKKLGFELAEDFGNFISFTTDDSHIHFSLMEDKTDTTKIPGKQVCVFYSDGIEGLYKKVKYLKINIATELYEAPFGKTFAIRNPDDNKIEFVQ